ESDQRACELRHDQVQFRDEMTTLSIADYAEETVSLMNTVQQRLGVPIWLVQNFVVRMLVPLDPGQQVAAQLLFERLFNLPGPAMETFQRPLAGACLRFIFLPHPQAPSQF